MLNNFHIFLFASPSVSSSTSILSRIWETKCIHLRSLYLRFLPLFFALCHLFQKKESTSPPHLNWSNGLVWKWEYSDEKWPEVLVFSTCTWSTCSTQCNCFDNDEAVWIDAVSWFRYWKIWKMIWKVQSFLCHQYSLDQHNYTISWNFPIRFPAKNFEVSFILFWSQNESWFVVWNYKNFFNYKNSR